MTVANMHTVGLRDDLRVIKEKLDHHEQRRRSSLNATQPQGDEVARQGGVDHRSAGIEAVELFGVRLNVAARLGKFTLKVRLHFGGHADDGTRDVGESS